MVPGQSVSQCGCSSEPVDRAVTSAVLCSAVHIFEELRPLYEDQRLVPNICASIIGTEVLFAPALPLSALLTAAILSTV